MTPEEAGEYELTRGPYKGQTIADLFEEDIDYFIYLRDSDLTKVKDEEPVSAAQAYALLPEVQLKLMQYEG